MGFYRRRTFATGLHFVAEPQAQGEKNFNLVTASSRSTLGLALKRKEIWQDDFHYLPKINDKNFPDLILSLMGVLETYGLVEQVDEDGGVQGYQLLGEFLQWKAVTEKSELEPTTPYHSDNDYYRNLYTTIATMLQQGGRSLFDLEAREHTAQVEIKDREAREKLFRSAELKTLFCSPTMELGVDIASLNTVYLRNVPPTPANYAQRSGPIPEMSDDSKNIKTTEKPGLLKGDFQKEGFCVDNRPRKRGKIGY